SQNSSALATLARLAFITKQLVDEWLVADIASEVSKFPLLIELRDDSGGREKWKHLSEFFHSLHEHLREIEITSRCHLSENGFINLNAWRQRGDRVRPKEASKQFDFSIKNRNVSRDKNLMQAWNII